MTTTATAPAAPDWERIELDYRAGIMTLRQIGADQGVSEGAIRKRAKKEGWTRDLAAKIQAKADELVLREAVRDEQRPSPAAEREVIEANALAVADVRLAHRRDVHRSRRICMGLLEELELQTGADNVALLQALGDMLRDEDEHGRDRLNDLYRKVIELPDRARTMKALADSLRVLVDLERQAFGMDDKDAQPVDAFTTMLNRISSGTSSAFMPVAHDPERDED
ncbi:MAG TPA: hypothetical protein VIZ86_16675 [Pseudomonas sp.]